MTYQIDDQLIEKFFDVSKQMHQVTTVNSLISQFSMREMVVLILVKKQHAVTIQQIATHLKITMPTASVLLDKLQNNNLIDRFQNPNDKRSTLVKLSPKAEKIIAKLIKAKNQKIKLCLSYLSPDDKQTLFQILDKLLLKINSLHEKK